jgi:arylsulfatase A-like enzyme
MREKPNVILISSDEVRADHLSCYGYKKIKTTNIDALAKDSVLFETCVSASSFTAICMSSVLTSNFPYSHTVRDAFQYLQGKTVAEAFKENGYKTAGFVGVGVLGSNHGFHRGFDYFNEADEENSWFASVLEGGEELFFVGNWWLEKCFKWIRENKSERFFIWGHFLETHSESEDFLIREGLIKEGELADLGYMDAKIKMMDEKLVGGLIKLLKELDLYDNTVIGFMSDHGCNIGEHPAEPLPHHPDNRYPQHSSAWDCELLVPLIIKSKDMPKNKRIVGMARSIDISPTLLELAGISTEDLGFEGVSLVEDIKKGSVAPRETYIENLSEMMFPGAFQALRTPTHKFIRNITKSTEEYYDLEKDPIEQNNIVETLRNYDRPELMRIRAKLNDCLWRKIMRSAHHFSNEEEEKIKQRLRGLGYMH